MSCRADDLAKDDSARNIGRPRATSKRQQDSDAPSFIWKRRSQPISGRNQPPPPPPPFERLFRCRIVWAARVSRCSGPNPAPAEHVKRLDTHARKTPVDRRLSDGARALVEAIELASVFARSLARYTVVKAANDRAKFARSQRPANWLAKRQPLPLQLVGESIAAICCGCGSPTQICRKTNTLLPLTFAPPSFRRRRPIEIPFLATSKTYHLFFSKFPYQLKREPTKSANWHFSKSEFFLPFDD